MSTNSEQWMRDAVAEIFSEESINITDEENLFEAGLDSVGLLRLVNRCRRNGLQVSFSDLARKPTLASWIDLINQGKNPQEQIVSKRDDILITNTHSDGGESTSLGVMQHAYWVGRSSGQRLGGVAAHLYAEFDQAATDGSSAIDPNSLRSALKKLLERHETLRTRITSDGKQIVLQTFPLPFAVYDLREHSAVDVQNHLSKIRDTFSHQMLNVEEGEVISVALSLLPHGATRLHVDVDMIAADAVSYRILLADFAAFYASEEINLPPLGLKYLDYLVNIERDRKVQTREAAEAWNDRMSELPGAPILPEIIQGAEDSLPPQVARRYVWLSSEQKHKLFDLTRRNGVTVAMTIATILAEVVGYWSVTDHFLLNVPIFDRSANHPDIDRIVGDFSSSVMLEVDLRKSLTFIDRVRALQHRMHTDAAHAAYTGLDVLRDLSRQRGETVLAPVVFTSALGLGELFSSKVTAVIGQPVWVISQGPQVLLDAQVTEFNNGLLVNWDTREEAIIPGVVDAMFDAFETILQHIISKPDAWMHPIQIPIKQEVLQRIVDGHPVRIVDRLGRDCPDHVRGQIQNINEEPSNFLRWGRAEGDGQVKLLGDDNEQVEAYGFSIWPLEVEEAIRSDNRIREVSVIKMDKNLVAAVVFKSPESGETVPIGKTFRAQLARRVPAHLLPTQIIVLNELPLDDSGQVDSNAIRKLISDHSEPADYVAPRTNLERVIAEVWAEILGLERVGVNEEFIALGGDSLLAARVVARLQEELDTSAITLRVLFRSPTIAELAEQLRKDDDPARLDEVAAIVLEIRAMSDEEVTAQLGELPVSESTMQNGTVS